LFSFEAQIKATVANLTYILAKQTVGHTIYHHRPVDFCCFASVWTAEADRNR
jgi:hypothetical protein